MHSDGVRGVIIPNKKEPNLLKFRFFLFGKISPIKISPQTPSYRIYLFRKRISLLQNLAGNR